MPPSLEEMVTRWEQVARSARTYNLTLDDWLNDLDLRDMIDRRSSDGTTASATLRARLEAADRSFRDNTSESKRSMWGPTAGADHHAARHWWYFRYPSSPGNVLRLDLQVAGILPKS